MPRSGFATGPRTGSRWAIRGSHTHSACTRHCGWALFSLTAVLSHMHACMHAQVGLAIGSINMLVLLLVGWKLVWCVLGAPHTVHAHTPHCTLFPHCGERALSVVQVRAAPAAVLPVHAGARAARAAVPAALRVRPVEGEARGVGWDGGRSGGGRGWGGGSEAVKMAHVARRVLSLVFAPVPSL